MEFIADYMPLNEDEYDVKEFKTSSEGWECRVNCKISSEQEIENFVKEYMSLTGETLKIKLKKPETEKGQYKVRAFYRCTHNTRYEETREVSKILAKTPNKRFKNTFCPFQISFKISKASFNFENFPCSVVIEHYHNHPVASLEVTSFRSIDGSVKEKIYALFDSGMTASQAYYGFIRDLKRGCIDEMDFHVQKANRSTCPRRRDFNVLYAKHCKERYGGRNGETMFAMLEDNIKTLVGEKNIKIKYQPYDKEEEKSLIIAIVTPLMTRVHSKIKEAAEMMFVDSTSNLDEFNLRFFLFCTHSTVGALPLGILITSDEKEETLIKGMRMLEDILPEDAFHNRISGPAVIMSDNCDELRNSLHSVWPESTLLFCIFHILQQVWRWLFEKNHGVNKDDRVEIMKLFRQAVYAPCEEEFEVATKALFSSNKFLKYSNCVEYFNDLWIQKESWACCFRKKLLIRGSNTNNYVEAQFLVIKDTILNRQRQYNVNMLLEKLIDNLEDHFKLRLASASDGTFDGIYSNRFIGSKFGSMISESVAEKVLENAVEIFENLFSVPSKTDPLQSYLVDMSIGRCECYVGSNGAPCIHQYLLWSRKKIACDNFLPRNDSQKRQLFAYIAFGSSLDINYYQSLHSQFSMQGETQEIQTVDPSKTEPVSEFHGGKSEEDSCDVSLNAEKHDKIFEDAQMELDKVYNSLKESISSQNLEFGKAILKFSKRYQNITENQKISALHSFGSVFVGKTRGKIKVQPTAVSRRKSGIGSRQKQSTKKHGELPYRRCQRKRKHDLSKAISENVPSAKKAGRSMISNTKLLTKKNASK